MEWMTPEEVDRFANEKLAQINAQWILAPFMSTAISGWRGAMRQIAQRGEGRTVDIEMQAARIGECVVIAVNGEMFSRFTTSVRAQSGSEDVLVVAYANAAFGYIPTREAYPEGGYEVETAHYFYRSFRPRPGALELLAERAADLVKELRRAPAAG
jgi:hypothetical protein